METRKIKKLINLTFKPIRILDNDKNVICTIDPAPEEERATISVTRKRSVPFELDGIVIPSFDYEYGEVKNIPEEEEGVVYIVSSLVAQRVPERMDVFIPNESVRDEKGRIIGCKSLGRI